MNILAWLCILTCLGECIFWKFNLLKPLKYKLNHNTLEVLFKSLVRSSLEYGDVVWDGCSQPDSNLLESLQLEGGRVVTGVLKGTNWVSLLKELSWVDLSVRRKFHKLSLMYKIVFKLAPDSVSDIIPFLCTPASAVTCSDEIQQKKSKKVAHLVTLCT